MSFSRAKIHRFNDQKTDVPSPTRYDPKLGEKAKGGIISKDRERTTSASEATSTGTTPFRTPYAVVKKHSCYASSEKSAVARGMNFNEVGVSPFHHQNDDDHLRHELAEKSFAIADLQRVVDELSDKLRDTESEKKQFELQVVALELAKSDLECLVANSKNCEKQVQDLTETIQVLNAQLESLELEKRDLISKWSEEETRISKLEDGNVEYERRILCLEGTLEEVKREYNEKVQEVQRLQETSEKLKISIECLQGKVSTLENEISKLEAERGTNEETIFGLEERASLLNSSLEAAKAEIQSHKEVIAKVSAELEEQRKACLLHENTITGLDMQLEAKQLEIIKITGESKEKIANLDQEIKNLQNTVSSMEESSKIKEQELSNALTLQDNLIRDHELIVKDYKEEIIRLSSEKDALENELRQVISAKEQEILEMKDEKARLLKAHDEEIFHLQNHWETKIFAQMQESEQAILEKEAVMKLADLKHTKMLSDAKEEWERQLRQAEEEACRRQSAQLEAGEMLKAKYETKISDLEQRMSESIRQKDQELSAEAERYEEICQELSVHIQLVKEKEEEIALLKNSNNKSSTRLNNLLEEVKILNSEIDEKNKQLEEMTLKFKDEWKKNEKLSEQLGELDSKVASVEEELKVRGADNERLAGDLKKVRDECNELKVKNLDLQLDLATQQDTARNLTTELESARAKFNSQIVDLNAELASVKRQCRKFEIAMTDTRKSLEVLGQRLIESENEVERLNQENDMVKNQLAMAENEKNDADNNYRLLMDMKIDLEQRIVAAEDIEILLRSKVKELEQNNCDLELKWNEVVILKDTLEEDKKNYEAALAALKHVVNDQNLKLIQMERETLEQVEAVSQILMQKLEEFEKFSTEKIKNLNSEIQRLTSEKESILSEYQSKCEEYENLFTDHDILKTTFDIATKESQAVKKQCEIQEAKLKNAIEELNLAEIEKTELSNKLETSNMASENLARDLEEKISKLQEMNNTNTKYEEKVTELDLELSKKMSIIESMTSEISQMRADFEEQITLLRNEKNKEIDDLLQEKEEYKEKMLKNTDEVVALLLNIEAERNNVEYLEKSNQKLTQSIDILQSEVASLHMENKEAKKNNEELVNRLSSLQSEIVDLQNERQTAKSASEEKIKELENELVKAKDGGDWKVKWESLLKEKEAVNSDLVTMTEKKEMYKSFCRKLETQLKDAQTDCETAVKDFDEIHGLLKSKDAENEKLTKMIRDLESLIGPFREQLEQYETERVLLENDRELLRRQHLEQAGKLGHQNHKQKIQHVVRLKQDILELRNENKKLQVELKTKSKTIERLREEVGEHPKRLFMNGKRPTSTPFKGKENDERASPIHIKQEPMSPFKERNC